MLVHAMAALLLTAIQCAAQQRAALTAADYARAESFLLYKTNPLVLHGGVRPTWLPDGRFWYRTATEKGSEAILVDPVKGERIPGFDPAAVAGPSPAVDRNEVLSPDKKRVAFLRDYNLWVRDLATRRETQLTKDGVKDFGYATDNAGWIKSDRPVVVWSPDSTRLATFQQDERGVGEMYLVDTPVGHPRLFAWKYPMAGDETVVSIQRVVIDVAGARVVRLQMPPDAHRSTYYDDLAMFGDWGDVQWSPDSTQLVFASVSRDHKHVQVRAASPATGAVRDVFDETAATFFGSAEGRLNWKFLGASHEVVWYSERDDWGNLYLYDSETGRLKNRITRGEGNVMQLVRVDETARAVYFSGMGKERGRDPYFRHFYRASLDGKEQTLLTPQDANHEVSLSPDNRYFVDTYSRPDVPPVSVLRKSDGALISTLERADISRLVAAGWKPPIPITVKGRDGVTDLCGLMYKPTNFDAAKKYPIVNHVYPDGSVGPRNFLPSRSDSQAMAELGFIVVEIDGMGTPGRSKRYFDLAYGNLSDSTVPDQVAGMKDLARRYPWIDIERAGIHGHSGGGYTTARAMFQYPDFFKVGVSQAGDHDNRAYEDDWVELAQGLMVRKPDGSSNYDSQANQSIAKNLKGHLLLAHGTMDTNVSPYNTLLVVDELIKANKDFDLLLLPNRGHGFGSEPYMMRRRWDYFVRYLLGAEPPKEYELRSPGNLR
jgi:dipeptidyl aminopeptidase/acylaminoacyl peptidase